MSKKKAVLFLGLCALLPAAPAEKDQAYARLIHEFMAPCCWQQRLDVHDSPAADDLRRRIRNWLAAGRTEDDVRQAMVAEFGVRILPEPPGTKAVFLYAAPFVVLALGGVGVWVYIRKLRHRRPALAEVEPAPLPDEDWE